MLEQQLQAKVLDDVHGLVTYQDPPRTRFVRAEVTATGIKSVETFLTDFDALFHANPVFPPKQELAIDLYGASQFEASTCARFLTLLVAVEALLEPCDRSPGAQELVRSLIEQTAGSNLPNAEKDSIVGSLNWLFKESIRKSGGRLAQEVLGQTQYGGTSASDFFTYCYDLRSQLVHEGRFDDPDTDLLGLCNELERFVVALLGSITGFGDV